MIIIFKITDYFPETNQIAVKFCNEKSSKPIDEYSALAVGLKDIDTSDVESFSEELVNKSGMRRLEKQDRKLTTLDDNKPEKIEGELNINDLIGKVIGVNYPTRIYKKIKMRRVESVSYTHLTLPTSDLV